MSNLINFLNPRAPKGLVPSAAEWAVQRRVKAALLRQPQPSAWMKEAFSAEDSFHTLAYPLEPSPGEEFSSVRWTANAPASLYYLRGCRVLGNAGAVISPDNEVFADFTMPRGDTWPEHSLLQPPAHSARDAAERLLRDDCLARVEVLSSLRGLGIAEDKLIPLDASAHFQPEHLFILHAFAMYNPPRWAHTWFKQAFLADAPHSAAAPKRLHISRADAPFRSTIIEVIPPRWMAPCFMALATSAGQQLPRFTPDDIHVPLASLEQLLQSVLSS